MRTISIINQKGGCGKTTTAINLSSVLARAGKRVLLVDMDPQSHCAAGLGIPEQRIEMDIGDAMLALGVKPIDPARLLWRAVRNLDLAPSRMKLAGLEATRGGLAQLSDKHRRLTAVLEKLKHDYDIAVIDCPPSIGLLTYNALAAADMVVIPVETGFFSLQGANRQVNTVKTLSKRLGMQISVWILPTLHDPANTVATDLLEELHRRFKDRVVPVIVRRDVRLREAASFGQTIVDYAPSSMGAEDYGRLGVWVQENLTGRVQMPVELAAENTESGSDLEVVTTPAVSNAPTTRAATPASGPMVEPRPIATDDSTSPALPVVDTDGLSNEPKPLSRAEDVARRAQEFLRKLALGRTGTTTPGTGSPEVWGHTTPPMAPGGAVTEPKSATVPPPFNTETTIAGTVLHPPRQVLTVMEHTSAAPVAISPSAQRLLGIRETNQGVLFVQPLTQGRHVSIAGSFNGWSSTAHPLRRNEDLGVFEICLKLAPGKILYRLVIDGLWTADPHNDHCEPNPFGEVNSVFYVGAHAAATVPA